MEYVVRGRDQLIRASFVHIKPMQHTVAVNFTEASVGSG
jgi:hypothetical protein